MHKYLISKLIINKSALNFLMEFTPKGYKRCVGNVFTTADGFKYVQSKMTENYFYHKCAIFRNGCKGTSKLNRTRNLITLMHLHNNEVSE